MNSGIFNIAKELFYYKGYSKTKISDITGKLGLVPGNFYRYYPSKEAILKKLILTESLEYLDELKSVNNKTSFHDKLKILIGVNLRLIFEKPRFFNLLMEIKSIEHKLDKSTLKAAESIPTLTKNTIEDVLAVSTLDPFTKKIALEIITKNLKIFLENLIKDSHGNNCPDRILTLDYSEKFDHLFDLIRSSCHSLGISNNIFSKLDSLTNTYKRSYFIDLLTKSYDFLGTQEESLELLYIRIDGISEDSNAFFNHSILKDVGIFLNNSFRRDDKIGRWDYNSFVILFSSFDSSLFKHLAERSMELEEILKRKYKKNTSLHVDFHVLTLGGGELIDFDTLFSSESNFERYCQKKYLRRSL